MDLAPFGSFLPEMNPSRSPHPGSGLRTRISVPSTIPVRTVRSEVSDDLGELPQPDSGGDRAAPLGQQGGTSPIARVMVERSTSHQQDRWYVAGRAMAERWARVANRHSMEASWRFAPAVTARQRGREASVAGCRSRRNGPISARSSAITSGVRLVIRRLRLASDDRCTCLVPHRTGTDQRSRSRRAPADHARARWAGLRVLPAAVSGT